MPLVGYAIFRGNELQPSRLSDRSSLTKSREVERGWEGDTRTARRELCSLSYVRGTSDCCKLYAERLFSSRSTFLSPSLSLSLVVATGWKVRGARGGGGMIMHTRECDKSNKRGFGGCGKQTPRVGEAREELIEIRI